MFHRLHQPPCTTCDQAPVAGGLDTEARAVRLHALRRRATLRPSEDGSPGRLAMTCPHCRHAIEIWCEPKTEAAEWLVNTFACPKCGAVIREKLPSRFSHAVVLGPPKS